MKVAIPVAVEKSPMKEEYSFGLGNCKKSGRHKSYEVKEPINNETGREKLDQDLPEL